MPPNEKGGISFALAFVSPIFAAKTASDARKLRKPKSGNKMATKFLKRLQWTLTILIAVLLVCALITGDFMVLADLWFPVWMVLWVSLSLWYVNRSRLEHLTDRWRKRNEKAGQKTQEV